MERHIDRDGEKDDQTDRQTDREKGNNIKHIKYKNKYLR